MRILYFSSRDCWPLTTGARIRDYQLALYLYAQASAIPPPGAGAGNGAPHKRAEGQLLRECDAQ